MASLPDPLSLTEKLISCPSVTPATGAVFDVLQAALEPLGFAVSRTLDGPDGEQVENMIAVRDAGPATSGKHFAFAGHLDVVPPGDGWTSDAFTPRRAGSMLYGRGAVDMKGAIAAFVAAVEMLPRDAGTISLLITGDEEGNALHGTRALMDHMAAQNLRPDMILVGEPTSVHRLGDTIKIGRRGSVNIWIDVAGTQGHVAYPHLADNPIPKLVRMLADINAIHLDDGTDWFQPSNIELTDMSVGNMATNVIPAKASARLSIRFNDRHQGAALVQRIEQVVHAVDPGATVRAMISGEAFLTQPGELSDLVSTSIRDVTGITPELSTSGGTSDARFLHVLAPIVEFGLPNATMHKLDEAVAIPDLAALSAIYRCIVERAFGIAA